MKLEIWAKPQSVRTGTKDNPFRSGGTHFGSKLTGVNGQVVWIHRWVVGGVPIPENTTTPEMWYGRDGGGQTPSFHPTRKTTLSCAEITAWVEGYKSETTTSIKVWIMAATDEPTPSFAIQCDDGVARVSKLELDWLKDNSHLEMVPPRPKYNGTIAALNALIESIEPNPQPEPNPTGHPINCSDGRVCVSTHELTWLLSKGKVGNAGGKTYFNGDVATLEAIVKVIPPPKPPPEPEPEPEEPMQYRYFVPLRVVDDIDTGLFLSATQKAEVKLSLFKQRVPSSDEGELQDVKTLTLGAYNPITKMVKGNWHVEADLALIVSDKPIACCAVWVTKETLTPAEAEVLKKQYREQYTGFPGLEA